LLDYVRLGPSYATVRDYCDSVDRFPDLATRQQDLKDVQRPWAVKAVLALLPPGARLLEIGSGEPTAAARLASLGYDVTICDPFDGSGNGPTQYRSIKWRFRNVTFIRSLFDLEIARRFPAAFDGIFSISVLEHVPAEALDELFEAIGLSLAPGGYSMHAVDHVLQGPGDDYHHSHLTRIMQHQQRLTGRPADDEARVEFSEVIEEARQDVGTFYLSPQGHNLWRGGMTYDEFPFRKCISVQTIIRRPESGVMREER
jgi:hypothetical protein